MPASSARRTGPEDSGGTWGYQEKLDILRNPDPREEWHQEVIEWMGSSDFDPEAFDTDAVKRWIVKRSQPPAQSPRGKKRRKRKSR